METWFIILISLFLFAVILGFVFVALKAREHDKSLPNDFKDKNVAGEFCRKKALSYIRSFLHFSILIRRWAY